MMETRLTIDTDRIPAAGIDLEGDLSPDVFAVAEAGRLACEEPLHYRLHASMVDGKLLVQGTLQTTLQCTCDRCLESYEQTVTVAGLCRYFEDETEAEVDLTEELREDIVIDFPAKLLCSPECRGICPGCGTNLNLDRCACETETAPPSVWDELDKLAPPASEAGPETHGIDFHENSS